MNEQKHKTFRLENIDDDYVTSDEFFEAIEILHQRNQKRPRNARIVKYRNMTIKEMIEIVLN